MKDEKPTPTGRTSKYGEKTTLGQDSGRKALLQWQAQEFGGTGYF